MTAVLLFLCIVAVILIGYPVAFTLAGVSLLFMLFGILTGVFDATWLHALNPRLFSIITNETLIAIPLFIFMGIVLQKSRIAENLLNTFADLLVWLRGGLGITVVLIGALLAASTGIVGATVITMGVLSLPVMLKRGYSPAIACGTICAAGTLGQVIPPSIVLILLGDTLSSAYQKAQLDLGQFSPNTVSVADLFAGAIIPGLILVGLYIVYLFSLGLFRPDLMPSGAASVRPSTARIVKAALAPLLLVVGVLGSILSGLATSTEAASVGAVGALALAFSQKAISRSIFTDCMRSTTRITCMVFAILIGASFFSLAFRGYGGDDLVHQALMQIPGGHISAFVAVMLVIFLLGFVLDFIEITLIVVPIVGPVLMKMGFDPVWLGIMLAVNLQTSFLTPPFGFSLFYLRSVAPQTVPTRQIYAGSIPFILLQLLGLIVLAIWPELATWLPGALF